MTGIDIDVTDIDFDVTMTTVIPTVVEQDAVGAERRDVVGVRLERLAGWRYGATAFTDERLPSQTELRLFSCQQPGNTGGAA